MAFPSTLENLPNNIQATDKVSVRDHAKLHNDVARVVNSLQTKMGVDFSSDHTTLDWMIRNMGPGGGSNVIRVSPPQNHVIGNVATFVHNLGFTQADIESGRYQIKFAYKVTTTPANGIDSAGVGALSGAPMTQQYIWDATDPVVPFNIHMQADSLKVLSSSRSDDLENVRCIIIDNNIVGGGILPPWTTTYQTSFLVEDSLGNAITDAVITFNGVTNNAGDYTFDTLLGNFSYSCDRLGYTTASGDVLIDGVSTHTIVLTATGAGMYNLTFDISSDLLGPLTDAIVTLNGVTYPVGQVVFNMPDDTYNYTVNRLGHDPVMGSVVVAGADVTEVVAMTALPPLYTATFYIEDNVGTPILDARIEFEGNTYPASHYDFITNAGTYNYTVHRRGYTSVSGTLVLSGNTTITITMDPNAALHTVDFTVEDTMGMPIAGASINLNGIQFSAGQYSFNLPAGTYTYVVSKTGYYSAGSFVVVAGPTIENVVLTALPTPTTYTATFQIFDDVTPITDAIIVFGGQTYSAGTYVFSDLSNGVYQYQVHKGGFDMGSGVVVISGGDVTETVSMVQNSDIHTVLFNVTDGVDPITDAIVTFGGDTYNEGTYVFSVENDTYTYAVQKTGYNIVFGSIIVSSSDVIENVVLVANAFQFTYTFEVEDNLGSPILDAIITLSGTQFPAGTYSFVLPADTYNRGVSKIGYDTEIGTKILSTNATESVVLVLVLEEIIEVEGYAGWGLDVGSVYVSDGIGASGRIVKLNEATLSEELNVPYAGFTKSNGGVCVLGSYVFSTTDNEIVRADKTTLIVDINIPVSATSHLLISTYGGYIYTIDYGGILTKYDVDLNVIATAPTIPFAGVDPGAWTIDQNTGIIYVAPRHKFMIISIDSNLTSRSTLMSSTGVNNLSMLSIAGPSDEYLYLARTETHELHKIDKSTGAIISSIPAPRYDIPYQGYMIGYQGYLYIGTGQTYGGSVFKFNISTSIIDYTFSISGKPRDMKILSTNLYGKTTSGIFKIKLI